MSEKKIRDCITKNIIFYRKMHKLTQKELAKKLGVATTTVSSWERNVCSPEIEVLFMICELFNIPLNEMCGYSSNPVSSNFTVEEVQFISTYRKLNKDGRERLSERAEELITLGFTSDVKGESKEMA